VATHVNNLVECLSRSGVRIVRVEVGSSRWGRGPRALLGFLRVCRETWRGRGLVYLNPSFDARSIWRDGFLAWLARRRGAKVVVHFHGGRPREVLDRRLSRAAFRGTIAKSDRLYVLSREQQAELTDLAAQAEIVPYVIDAQAFSVLGPRTDARRILFLSRMAEDKGVLDLVDAAARLSADALDVELLLAGDGPVAGDALKRCRDLRLAHRYLGVVRGRRLRQTFTDADIFALPSWHAEGFPLAILEAMAAGLPVVCTPMGAIPDRLEDGKHALFVPPREPERLATALRALLTDHALRREMSRANRAYVEINHGFDTAGPLHVERLAALVRQGDDWKRDG
jgi:glycosyltransferase involved in cell wall biosynthesis